MESKELGLALVSVLLFIGATVYNVLVNNKLQDIKNEQDDMKTQFSDNMTKVSDRLDDIEDGVKENGNVGNIAYQEVHEQWSRLNTVHQLMNENTIRLADVSDAVKDVAHQQTVLATSQLSQAQQHEKVVAGLLDVLQDHARD